MTPNSEGLIRLAVWILVQSLDQSLETERLHLSFRAEQIHSAKIAKQDSPGLMLCLLQTITKFNFRKLAAGIHPYLPECSEVGPSRCEVA